jgi:uncharacterized protein YceK
MKNVFLIICTSLILSGCSTFETLGDYVKDNPVFASTAFRYATAKYINNDDKRAAQVVERGSKVLAFIDSNPTVTVSAVMQYLDATIDWSSLDLADRLLVQDIISIVEADLRAQESQNPLVNVREVFEVIVNAALLYGK